MKRTFNDSLGINIKQYICYAMMILVTGAAGQIGTDLTTTLREKFGNQKVSSPQIWHPKGRGTFHQRQNRDPNN